MKKVFTILEKALYLSPVLSLHSCVESPQKDEAKDDKPNIIFFITDDMQDYMFNCLPSGAGKNLSPNIDLLAKEGIVMEGAHVSSAVSTPSRFACLTGMYASRSNCDGFMYDTEKFDGQTAVQWNSYMKEGQRTIGTLLQGLGYKTGFFGKNHAIEAPGWEKLDINADPESSESIAILQKNKELKERAIKASGFDFAQSIYQDNPNYLGSLKLRYHNIDWVTDNALSFIDSVHQEPYFMYYATTVPHGPYTAEKSWDNDRTVTSEGILSGAPNVQPTRESIKQRLVEAGLATDSTINNEVANVLWIDDALGALIAKLKETGDYDNTIIVFMSDHGQSAKGSCYEGGVSTPLIIWKSGGFAAGNRNNALVSNIDFVPTLFDIAGGKSDTISGIDGVSMLPLLNGEVDKIHESLYFEMGFSRGILKDSIKYIALRYPEYANNWTYEQRDSVLTKWNDFRKANQYAYHFTDPNMPFSHLMLLPGGGDAEYWSMKKYPHYYETDQLYDLRKDNKEQINLIDDKDYQVALDDLRNELTQYLNTLPGVFGEFKK